VTHPGYSEAIPISARCFGGGNPEWALKGLSSQVGSCTSLNGEVLCDLEVEIEADSPKEVVEQNGRSTMTWTPC
jgi:hypothetical protein